MQAGVTIRDPYVDVDRRDGRDRAGRDHRAERRSCAAARASAATRVIRAGSQIVDSTIGERCVIWASVIEASTVGNDVKVGPFAHLRAGCDDRRRRRDRQLRRAEEHALRRALQAAPLQLPGRRRGRRGRQHRRRHDHRQLRRQAQAPHGHRRRRVHRLGHDPARADDRGRGRLHRRRIGRHQGRAAGQAGRGRACAHPRAPRQPRTEDDELAELTVEILIIAILIFLNAPVRRRRVLARSRAPHAHRAARRRGQLAARAASTACSASRAASWPPSRSA